MSDGWTKDVNTSGLQLPGGGLSGGTEGVKGQSPDYPTTLASNAAHQSGNAKGLRQQERGIVGLG